MPDSAVLVANLHTGNIDLAERVLPTDVAEVKKDTKLRIVTSPALGYRRGHLQPGATATGRRRPIGQNALLRQAFDAAIDRQALIEVVFNGMYQPTVQAVPASSPFYVPRPGAASRGTSPRAQALVKQSGVPTPIAVTMNVPNTAGPHAAGRGDPVDGARRRLRPEDQFVRVRVVVERRRRRATSRPI